LPGDLLLGHPGTHVEGEGAPKPVFDVYVSWLHTPPCYAWQVPGRAIVDRARKVGDIEADRLDEVERVLARPSSWLFADVDIEKNAWAWLRAESQCSSCVAKYAEAVKNRKIPPDREHFIRWLGWQQEREERRAKRLRGLDFENAGETAPFSLLLEYGWHRGWGIPTARQWEKACRGADGRCYPWGDQPDDGAAWIDRTIETDPFSVTILLRDSSDESPYGIRHLAGNVSEWVIVEDDDAVRIELHWLKGGNYAYGPSYAKAGHLFGVTGACSTLWTGLRLVRELRER
jgi:hypothetical protein